jgi:hypothetical protein
LADLEKGFGFRLLLSKILQLKPKTFFYRQDSGLGLPQDIQEGFLAQEVAEIFPSLIVTKGFPNVPKQRTLTEADSAQNSQGLLSEKYLGLDYIKMIPYIVQAIQEQNNLIQKQSESITLLINALATNNIDESKKLYTINIFPNPASGDIQVEVNSSNGAASSFDLKIFDRDGKQIFSQNANQNKTIISNGQLPEGTYFFSISIAGEIYEVKRIVISN